VGEIHLRHQATSPSTYPWLYPGTTGVRVVILAHHSLCILRKYSPELTQIRRRSSGGQEGILISTITHRPFLNRCVFYHIFWSQYLTACLGYPRLSWISSGWNLRPNVATCSRSQAVPAACLSHGWRNPRNNFREAKPCRRGKLLVDGNIFTALPFSGQIFYHLSTE